MTNDFWSRFVLIKRVQCHHGRFIENDFVPRSPLLTFTQRSCRKVGRILGLIGSIESKFSSENEIGLLSSSPVVDGGAGAAGRGGVEFVRALSLSVFLGLSQSQLVSQ